MSNDVSIVLQKREVLGKGLGKLKAQGVIPAVIHNPGKDSIHVSGSLVDLAKAYELAGKHHPITVELDGKKFLTIIKDVDNEVAKHKLRHVVFGVIRQDEKVETEVPIVYATDEDSPAQKAGLLLIRHLDHVEIEALPKNLPDSVMVSIEELREVGDKVTVAEIIPQEGVTILTDPEHSIVSVEETPAQESAEAEEAASSEAATEADSSNAS